MTALEIPLSLKAHVNGHYGFRRELPTGPACRPLVADRDPLVSAPGLAFGRGDSCVIRARPITARKRSGLHGATVT
jgi:hypothetical protein